MEDAGEEVNWEGARRCEALLFLCRDDVEGVVDAVCCGLEGGALARLPHAQAVEEAEGAGSDDVDEDDADVVGEGDEEGGVVAAARVEDGLNTDCLRQARGDENEGGEEYPKRSASHVG